jgi:hypothetical protein
MADWTESLPTLDLDGLRPVFDELAGLEKDAGRQFGPTRRHITRTAKAIAKDARQHSKILVIETSDGHSYVAESSANLRSCASLEQTTIFADADLAAFHKGWIDALFMEAKV